MGNKYRILTAKHPIIFVHPISLYLKFFFIICCLHVHHRWNYSLKESSYFNNIIQSRLRYKVWINFRCCIMFERRHSNKPSWYSWFDTPQLQLFRCFDSAVKRSFRVRGVFWLKSVFDISFPSLKRAVRFTYSTFHLSNVSKSQMMWWLFLYIRDPKLIEDIWKMLRG